MKLCNLKLFYIINYKTNIKLQILNYIKYINFIKLHFIRAFIRATKIFSGSPQVTASYRLEKCSLEIVPYSCLIFIC